MGLSNTEDLKSCYLCGELSFDLLWNKDRNDKKVLNYVCSTCGFVQVFPRMTSNVKEELYEAGKFSEEARGDKVLTDEKIKRSELTSYNYFSILESFLGETLYKQGNSCLEIGCGSGSFLRYMKAASWKVEGIEPDGVFSNRGRLIYDIDIHNTFLEGFKTDKKYDLIASFHVIEHVLDPNTFLKKIYSLLKKDGLLYLECPSIDYMYGDSIDFFFWDVHINTFSNTTLASFLIKNGFKILSERNNRSFINIIAQKLDNYEKEDYKHRFDTKKRVFDLIENRKKKLDNNQTLIFVFKKKLKKVVKTWLKHTIKRKQIKDELKQDYTISHLGFHHSKNTGDIALFESIRTQFKHYFGSIDFKLLNLHSLVTLEVVESINKSDALIIGGGGLFLKDTNKNEVSGWQWPCSIEMLEKIKVPIIIYAVGYNRFRDQEDFEPFFSDNINALFNKSAFIGLRNTGSIVSVEKYIKPENFRKIVYQPCSTTLLKDYYQQLDKEREKKPRKTIAFNIAFDRHYLRYGSANSENKKLNAICNVIKKLLKSYHVVFFSHVTEDYHFNIWLKANNLNIEHINLVGKSVEETIRLYNTFDLIAGTRGHSQMIPFGLNIPILSIISHNKLQYFLEDNELENLGVDITDANLEKTLFEKIVSTLEHTPDLKSKQNNIRNITENNLKVIKSIIDEYKRNS